MALSPLAEMLQMQQPITPHTPTQVAPTDVTGAYALSTNAANQQYLAKLNQQNALWGGLAGLGGAGLQASILRGVFSPAAATPAASALPSSWLPASSVGAGANVPLSSAPGWASSILPSDLTGAAAGGTSVAGAVAPTADAAFTGGTSAVPFLTAGGDAAGTVGADLAAAAPAATDATGAGLAALFGAGGGAAAAADTGMSLADLLPFLAVA